MIEGLRPYKEYRESEVPWIGRVPTYWRVERTKRNFRSRKELNTGRRNTNVLSLTLRGVVNNDPESPEGMVPKDYATYQLFREHDLVFKLIDLENLRTSRVGLVHEDGIMSSAYIRLAPIKMANVHYFYYQFFDLYTRAVFNALGAGVRSTLGSVDLGELKIVVPPPDEQTAIVRFLDHANRKIGAFIRAKRNLIGLLNEQKQAIIETAISKVSTTDCMTMPVRAVLRPVKRMGHPQKTLLSLFRDYGVIPKDSRENKNVDVRDLSLCQLVNPGDVVMNKMKAWQGSIAVSNLEGIVSPDYMVLEFRIRPIVGDFFHYALRSPSMVANYRKQAYGVRPGQWRLMYPDFCRLRLPVPSIETQQTIVNYIKSETQDLNTAITRTEREIALMQEYRTRLTADLVTGKLDVREAAAKLPAPPSDTAVDSIEDDISGESEPEEIET